MDLQLYFFFLFFNSFELTSGTIKGTSGSILKKLELSITIDFSAAIGTYFSEIFPPAEKKAIFTFEKSKFSKSITSISLSLNLIFFLHF